MAIIAVVATHPDDETLGCGGTLLKHKRAGDSIHWIIVTAMTQTGGFSEQRIKERNAEIARVGDLYAFDGVHEMRLPTTAIDGLAMSELVGQAAGLISKIRPNILYLPFKSDVHSDHRVAFNAFYSCTKAFRYPFVRRILMMETLSETEFAPSTKEDSFLPNVFVDITDFIGQKLEIMDVYASELGADPFPRSKRSIEALATVRGATAGAFYAESFMLLKEIL